MKKSELEKLRELAKMASFAPWKYLSHESGGPTSGWGSCYIGQDFCGAWFNEYDSNFICAARNTMPALLDYVERLEKVAKAAWRADACKEHVVIARLKGCDDCDLLNALKELDRGGDE